MTRANYLESGKQECGRAGWLEHLQETSSRHASPHEVGGHTPLGEAPLSVGEFKREAAQPEAAGFRGADIGSSSSASA